MVLASIGLELRTGGEVILALFESSEYLLYLLDVGLVARCIARETVPARGALRGGRALPADVAQAWRAVEEERVPHRRVPAVGWDVLLSTINEILVSRHRRV